MPPSPEQLWSHETEDWHQGVSHRLSTLPCWPCCMPSLLPSWPSPLSCEHSWDGAASTESWIPWVKALPWLQCTMAFNELCFLPEPPFLLCALGYPEAMGRGKLIAIPLHVFRIIVKPVVNFFLTTD